MTQPPLWETRGATIAQILDFPIGGRHILSIIWSPQELFSGRVDVQMIVKNFSWKLYLNAFVKGWQLILYDDNTRILQKYLII